MTDIIIASDQRAQRIIDHLENLDLSIRAWMQGGAMVVPRAIIGRLRNTADMIERIATDGKVSAIEPGTDTTSPIRAT